MARDVGRPRPQFQARRNGLNPTSPSIRVDIAPESGVVAGGGLGFALLRLPDGLILPRSRGQSDYAAILSTRAFNSNSIGLT
jgi:hypothetical protein